MEKKKSLDTEYFDQVYDANEDPWDFETSEYEAEKYTSTMAALSTKTYQNALEIGCSIGVLTKLLAVKCKHLLATDVSDKALEKAAERCKDILNITFKNLSFPAELPNDNYDLIMVSEVAYYLSPEDWEGAVGKMYEMLNDRGQIVLVHWLPEVHDYPQTGDEVHHSFAEKIQGKMQNILSTRAENYRIDVWEKSASA